MSKYSETKGIFFKQIINREDKNTIEMVVINPKDVGKNKVNTIKIKIIKGGIFPTF